MTSDLRPLLFAGARWYDTLQPPAGDEETAWYVAKSPRHDFWPGAALSAAAAFARDHGLVETYRSRFAAIRPVEITAARAEKEGRNASTKIWEIAHELIVGRYLERVLGWTYSAYEPPGADGCKGEWEFVSPSGRTVFVEVKSVAEREVLSSTGAYSRSPQTKRVKGPFKRAYEQLPDDGRATLVVIAGREILRPSFGIMHGDLFQTLFGRMQFTFTPMSDSPDYKLGPSLRDTLVNHTAHRKAGCVAGLCLAGLGMPEVMFYTIDNPYAAPGIRLPEEDLTNATRFIVDAEGHGDTRSGLNLEETWARMAQGIEAGD